MKGLNSVKSADLLSPMDSSPWIHMKQEFFRTLDLSLARSTAAEVLKGHSSQILSLYARGGRFSCYRMRRRGEAMDLAVNIGEVSETLETNLQHLGRLGIPLVPPMSSFWLDDDTLTLVMPFGDQDKRHVGPQFPRVEELLDVFHQKMEDAGFSLGDVPQIRCWNGIPFIHDFSELKGPF